MTGPQIRGASALAIRLRKLPRQAYLCAAISLAVNVAWGLITPPFQVTDETAHVAYVQYLAENGRVPAYDPGRQQGSAEEGALLSSLNFDLIKGVANNRTLSYPAQQAAVRGVERTRFDRAGTGSVGSASDNPPLYYLVQAVPYWLSPSHSLLDRLALMRLVSAVMSAFTVLAIFLFLREVLPGTPWAWTVGALASALQPLFGFVSGGVNPDALVFLASACIFLIVARCFRRGLSCGRGILLGLATAAGLLTKPIFLGLVPGVLLALVILVLRDRRWPTVRAGAVTLAGGLVPLAVYALIARTVGSHTLAPHAVNVGGASPEVRDLRRELNFVWQLFLPRLPFMTDRVLEAGGAAPQTGLTLKDLWFNGIVGRFGWIDYGFPAHVYERAWVVFEVVLVLFAAGLVRLRAAWRRRGTEIVCYLGLLAGVVLVVGVADYRARIQGLPHIEQARYLLPLLPLYAALVAVASLAAGRRWGMLLGAAILTLAAAHTVFSQLLTISRYYG